MPDYLDHGRRHTPGTGSDPIPGLAASAGLSVASLYSAPTGVSIAADNAQHYVSLQDGVSSAGFATTDTATFENLSTSLFTGSAVYGVGIKTTGTYAIFNNSTGVTGGTAGHKVNTYWAASNGSSPSFFQQGRTIAPTLDTWDQSLLIGPHLFTHEWMTVTTGQTPAVLVVWGKVDAGTAVTINFQMMVVQLTTNVLGKL